MIGILTTLKNVIEWALPALPDDEIKSRLSDTARKLADRIADLAEIAKFGP